MHSARTAVWDMEIDWSYLFVMFAGMVFGRVISQVGVARGPIQCKLLLCDTVFDPVESHVNSFGTFTFECTGNDAVGSLVVGTDRSWRLGVAHFN